MDIYPDNDSGNHERISARMIRKMTQHAHKYCGMLFNDDPLLKWSINNIKNGKDSEGVHEEDDANDINIQVDDNIE
jgi:hypothetical protein